jgi:hypothetical protein
MIGKHTYDASLQMFVQQPRGINVGWLRFLRWLAERGLLEHRLVGPRDGAFARLTGDPPDDRYSLGA